MSDLDNARAALASDGPGKIRPAETQLRIALRDLIAYTERLTAPPTDDERDLAMVLLDIANGGIDSSAAHRMARRIHLDFRRRGPVTDAETVARLHLGEIPDWIEAGMSTRTPELPEGFRIEPYVVSRDWVDGEEYVAQRLEHWETRTVGFWFWRREVTGWWLIECNNHREPLAKTAWMMERETA